jgi:hypothetical protein
LGSYRAEVVKDENKTLDLKGDCASTKMYKTPDFLIRKIVEI